MPSFADDLAAIQQEEQPPVPKPPTPSFEDDLRAVRGSSFEDDLAAVRAPAPAPTPPPKDPTRTRAYHDERERALDAISPPRPEEIGPGSPVRPASPVADHPIPVSPTPTPRARTKPLPYSARGFTDDSSVRITEPRGDITLPRDEPAAPPVLPSRNPWRVPAAATGPSAAGLDLIKEREGGFYAEPYQDSGGLAIGYGMQTWKGKPVTKDLRVTQDETDAEFLRQVTATYAPAFATKLTVPVTQHQYDALLSVALNAPTAAGHLAEKISRGERLTLPDFLASATVKGKPSASLRTRRAEEFAQFTTPDAPVAEPGTRMTVGPRYAVEGQFTPEELDTIARSEPAQQSATRSRQATLVPPQPPAAEPSPSDVYTRGRFTGLPKGGTGEVRDPLVTEAIQQIGRGTTALLTSSPSAEGVREPTMAEIEAQVASGATPLTDRQMDAMSDILQGSMTLATPLMVSAVIQQPVKTAVIVVAQLVVGKTAAKATEALGGSPSAQRLVETVTSAVATGIIGHEVTKIGADFRAVREQAAAFDAVNPPPPAGPTEPVPVGRGATAAAIEAKPKLEPVNEVLPPSPEPGAPPPPAPPLDTDAAVRDLAAATPDSPEARTAFAALHNAGWDVDTIVQAVAAARLAQPPAVLPEPGESLTHFQVRSRLGWETAKRIYDAHSEVAEPLTIREQLVEHTIEEGRAAGVPDNPVAQQLEAERQAILAASAKPAVVDTGETHTYSSTQIELPPATAAAVKALGASIPKADLAEDGKETDPHVTVKYGLHTGDVEKVREVLADEPPITVTLGTTSVFPDSGHGDVLKVDIDSPDLHRLNAKIADALEHTDTHPDYKPHATIAYLKPGKGKDYAGNDTLQGQTVTIDRITFSAKDGTLTEIPLTGAPARPTAPGDVTYFRSGIVNAPADFDGFANAQVPIGVTAKGITPAITDRAVKYVLKGGKVFVDSGAFSGEVDFDKLMAFYRTLTLRVGEKHSGGFYVVAPDVVGNQGETAKLQQQHAKALEALVARGVNVIVPMQKGVIPLAALMHAAPPDVIFGIPFNAAAYTAKEVADALDAYGQPARIHLFGIGERNYAFGNAIKTIRAGAPEGVAISADSNRIAALFGAGRPAHEAVQQKIEERAPERVDDAAESDTTELTGHFFGGQLDQFSGPEFEQLAKAARINPGELGEMRVAPSYPEWLQARLEAEGSEDAVMGAIHQIALARAAKVVAPQARTETITQHETGRAPAPVIHPRQALYVDLLQQAGFTVKAHKAGTLTVKGKHYTFTLAPQMTGVWVIRTSHPGHLKKPDGTKLKKLVREFNYNEEDRAVFAHPTRGYGAKLRAELANKTTPDIQSMVDYYNRPQPPKEGETLRARTQRELIAQVHRDELARREAEFAGEPRSEKRGGYTLSDIQFSEGNIAGTLVPRGDGQYDVRVFVGAQLTHEGSGGTRDEAMAALKKAFDYAVNTERQRATVPKRLGGTAPNESTTPLRVGDRVRVKLDGRQTEATVREILTVGKVGGKGVHRRRERARLHFIDREGHAMETLRDLTELVRIGPSHEEAEGRAAGTGDVTHGGVQERPAAPQSGAQPGGQRQDRGEPRAPSPAEQRAAHRRDVRERKRAAAVAERDIERDALNERVAFAVAHGYTGDPAALHRELVDRLQLLRDLDREFNADDGHSPVVLLSAIRDLGGLSLTRETALKGELRWLNEHAAEGGKGAKFGRVGNISGVFNQHGLSVDDMLTSLRQDPRFAYLHTLRDFLEELQAAISATSETPEALIDRFMRGLGEQWWVRIGVAPAATEGDLAAEAAAEDADVSFDPAALEAPSAELQPVSPDSGLLVNRVVDEGGTLQVGFHAIDTLEQAERVKAQLVAMFPNDHVDVGIVKRSPLFNDTVYFFKVNFWTPDGRLDYAASKRAAAELGGHMYEPVRPAPEAPPRVDVLDSGEAQPRLPEAGAARQVGQADVTFRAPAQASGEDFALEPQLTDEQKAADAAKAAGPSLFDDEPSFSRRRGPANETDAEKIARAKQLYLDRVYVNTAPMARPAMSAIHMAVALRDVGLPLRTGTAEQRQAAHEFLQRLLREAEGLADDEPRFARRTAGTTLRTAPASYEHGHLIVSTRVPSGTQMTERDAPLILSWDAVLAEAPEFVARMAEQVRPYPQVRARDKRGADADVVAAFLDTIEGNLRFLWDHMDPEDRDRAARFYHGAHRIARDAAAAYGLFDEQAVGVIARLSPGNPWDLNVSCALRVMSGFVRAREQNPTFTAARFARYRAGVMSTREYQRKTPAEKRGVLRGLNVEQRAYQDVRWDRLPVRGQAILLRVLDEQVNPQTYHLVLPEGEMGPIARRVDGVPSRFSWPTYQALAPALLMLHDGSPANIHVQLGDAHKVRSFFNNISDPDSPRGDVTVDVQCISGALLTPLSDSAPQYVRAIDRNRVIRAGLIGNYVVYGEAVRRLGAALDVLPMMAQAATWVDLRGFFTPAQKQNQAFIALVADLWQRHEAGKLSPDVVRTRIAAAAGRQRPAWHDQNARLAPDQNVLGQSDVLSARSAVPARRGDAGSRAGRVAGRTATVGRGTLGRRNAGQPTDGLVPVPHTEPSFSRRPHTGIWERPPRLPVSLREGEAAPRPTTPTETDADLFAREAETRADAEPRFMRRLYTQDLLPTTRQELVEALQHSPGLAQFPAYKKLMQAFNLQFQGTTPHDTMFDLDELPTPPSIRAAEELPEVTEGIRQTLTKTTRTLTQADLSAAKGRSGTGRHANRQRLMTPGQVPAGLLEQAKAQNEILKRTYHEMPDVKMGRHQVYVLDAGGRLTPAELDRLTSAPVLKQVMNAELEVLNEVIRAMEVPRLLTWQSGEGIERVGIVLDDRTAGVFLPRPASYVGGHRLAAILLNPFEHATVGKTPREAAEQAYYTAVHEALHWFIALDGGVFEVELATWLERLGEEFAERAITRIMNAYADGNRLNYKNPERYHPAFLELLSLYTESRGRPATREDSVSTAKHRGAGSATESGDEGEPGGPLRSRRKRPLTDADLQQLADDYGTTVEEERARAEAEGVTLQMTLLPGAAEFAEQDVLPTLKAAGDHFVDVGTELRRGLSAANVSVAGQTAAGIERARMATLAARYAQMQRAVIPFRDAFNKLLATPGGQDKAVDWWDAVQTGQPTQILPELHAAYVYMRAELDRRVPQIQAFGKLDQFNEFYFPQIWVFPKEDVLWIRRKIAGLFGRRPYEGPKGFLKKRKYPTFREGLDALLPKGVKPLSYNPVDHFVYRVAEMDKYILARRAIEEEYKPSGLWRAFGGQFGVKPDGWTRIEGPLGTIYGPRTIQTKEAFDPDLLEGLEKLLVDLGVSIKRVPTMGGHAWGYAIADKVVAARAAGPEGVVMHELGHILDVRYGFWNRIVQPAARESYTAKRGKHAGQTRQRAVREDPATVKARVAIKKELRALADLRFEGVKTTEHFKKYVREQPEKIANLVHAFLYAPDRAKQVAPRAYAALLGIIRAHGELAPLVTLQKTRSLKLGVRAHEIDIGGFPEIGYYAMPDDAARIFNRTIAPGLAGRSAIYDAYRWLNNSMVGWQLAASGLRHLTFTAINVLAGEGGLAMQEMVRGLERRDPRALTQGALRAAITAGSGAGGALVGFAVSGPGGAIWAAGLPLTVVKGIRGWKARQAWLTTPAGRFFTDHVREMQEGGFRPVWDDIYNNGGFEKALTALKTGNWPGALARTLPAMIDVVTLPVLRWAVPAVKAAAFLDGVAFELETLRTEVAAVEQAEQELSQYPTPKRARQALPTAQREAIRIAEAVRIDNLAVIRRALNAVQARIDNRFGEVVYENWFLPRWLKDLSHIALRSPGWQAGTYKDIPSAVIDQSRRVYDRATGGGGRGGAPPPGTPPPTPGGAHGGGTRAVPESILAPGVAFWLSLLITVTLLGGLSHYLATRKRPEDWQDYLYPMGPDGKRRAPPTYIGALASFLRHPFNTVVNVAAPMNPLLYRLFVTNETYRGEIIREPDDPWLQQAADALKEIASEGYVPFVAQTVQRGGGGVDSLMGIGMAPSEVTATKAEALLRDLQGPTRRTHEQQAQADVRREIREGVKAQTPAGAAAAQTAIASGQLSRAQILATVKSARRSSLQAGVRGLPLEQALRVYEVATPEERRELRAVFLAPGGDGHNKVQRGILGAPPNDRARLQARAKAMLTLPVAPAPSPAPAR